MPRSFLVKKTEKNKSSDKDRVHKSSPGHGYRLLHESVVPEVQVTEVVTTTPAMVAGSAAEVPGPLMSGPAEHGNHGTNTSSSSNSETEHIDIEEETSSKETMTVLDLSTRAEPLVSAVAPYTPHAFQPLAVRLANGESISFFYIGSSLKVNLHCL